MNEHTTPDGEQDRARPDDELVSAVLDGEATASERAIVEADPRLRARLEEFRALQESNRAIEPPDEAARDRAIARAVAEAPEPRTAGGGDPIVLAHHRRARRMAVLAAAAAVAIAVPLVAVFVVADREETEHVASDAAASQPDEQPTSAGAGVAGEEGAATTTEQSAFLGTFASLDELHEAARGADSSQNRRAAGSAFDAPASSTTAPPAAPEDATSAGTAEAQRCVALLAQGAKTVQWYATAVVAGEPVLVAVLGDPSPVLVVARPDCTVLDRSPL